jgi:hypothetical protein
MLPAATFKNGAPPHCSDQRAMNLAKNGARRRQRAQAWNFVLDFDDIWGGAT